MLVSTGLAEEIQNKQGSIRVLTAEANLAHEKFVEDKLPVCCSGV